MSLHDVFILSRILELVPVFLSVPATWFMIRTARAVRIKYGWASTVPFALLAVTLGLLLVTQTAWMLSLVHPPVQDTYLNTFSIGRTTRNILMAVSCIALDAFMRRVLKEPENVS